MNEKPNETNVMCTFRTIAKKLRNSSCEIFGLFEESLLADCQQENLCEWQNVEHIPKLKNDMEKAAFIGEVEKFADYFGVNNFQALVIGAVYAVELENAGIGGGQDEIEHFIGMDGIDFVLVRNELNVLAEKGFLQTSPSSFSERYSIPEDIESQMLGNKRFQLPQPKKLDRYDFCSKIDSLIDDFYENDRPFSRLCESVTDVVERSKHLDFVKNVENMKIAFYDKMMFYGICAAALNGSDCSANNMTMRVFPDRVEGFRVLKSIKDGSYVLQKNGLIEKSGADFSSEMTISLTDKGKRLFFEDDYAVFASEIRQYKNLISCSSIKKKTMFYADELKENINVLEKSLDDGSFIKLQERFEANGLAKGVTAVFYGEPGTGKTETVLQIARMTGRDVCHVDISQMKSCWYGDSEKIIKNVFVNYRQMCAESPVKPILLFNEADAVFGRRGSTANSSNVTATENAVQNIILEEMEHFDGVLIATTNLHGNLDSAFERRFVFKVRFDKPSADVKKKIWKNKLDWLSDADCRFFAERYDFSGGEIDNVVRKVITYEIVHDGKPNRNDVERFCDEEHFDNSRRRTMGFNSSQPITLIS